MKIRVIVCQNPSISGTPKEDRKASSIKQNLYFYTCEDGDVAFRMKDSYSGYSYQSNFTLDVGYIPENMRASILQDLPYKANARFNSDSSKEERILGKGDFELVAHDFVKALPKTSNVKTNSMFDQCKTKSDVTFKQSSISQKKP